MYIGNFNSHAHVERDKAVRAVSLMMIDISTHTLTWSVTAVTKTALNTSYNFNSHAHVERD